MGAVPAGGACSSESWAPAPRPHILGALGSQPETPAVARFRKQRRQGLHFLPESCLAESKPWTFGACSALFSFSGSWKISPERAQGH